MWAPSLTFPDAYGDLATERFTLGRVDNARSTGIVVYWIGSFPKTVVRSISRGEPAG